nr:hypothetical protein [Tessaracoccus sp. OS52]
MNEAWRECVGTGRLNLALRHDYVESLRLVQEQIGFRHIRGHGLLSDDMGIHRPYEHDGVRRVRHSFTHVDLVVDSWLQLGIRPFIELGFMPSALASGGQTVFWWKGNVTPPSDENEWVSLVRATVGHLVDRYGFEEVRHWPMEVWNEPNLTHFWKGADRGAYLRLYELTAHAIKDVDASLQVGGPALSPGSDDWWEPFAEFVTSREVPVDFVSRHAYSSGPAEHVPFGVYQTLQPPSTLLEQFDAPRRHLKDTRLAGLPVHITEFNTSYRPDNPVHDTAYNAAYLAPVLASGGNFVDSFSYWTFCDVFEEENVPTSIFHGGFGLLTHRQLPKPTYHLFTFMARLGPEILSRGDDHLVTRHTDGRLALLAWQPVDGTNPGSGGHTVELSLPVTAGRAVYVHRRRVSESDGNAWDAWRQLGRPHHPSERILGLLHDAARPAVERSTRLIQDGRIELKLTLSRHEVTLVELDAVADETAPWIDDSRIPGYVHSRPAARDRTKET